MADVQAEVANTEVISSNGHSNANNAPAETTNTGISRLEAGSEVEADDVTMVPDGGWGWMVVLGTFMVHLICDGIEYSFGVFVEDFVDYFESSRSAVGGIGSLMLGMTWGSGDVVLAYL